ncbi:lytic polysaccharide monooxygenase [Hypholoma sublateritium FD-334 SS-4]|uniref:Lytic polysaccharide monooxygenase n=1 Tax=Hypholoma sublateritium (strain FD-334 SS-4) TaxID=945553 RepID=A0A0D2LDW2_HYPSF|nr:lytic polysaccharide monooxygenase [Hypholoma sublateritium FD-334 SS-4]
MNILALSLLAFSTLYMAVTPASAHGYVSQPPSRQARCAAGQVPGCGAVQFEPQSVEAPHGSFLCNGNGARFPELNEDSLWAPHFAVVDAGVTTLTFTWTLTAPHRTTTWEYFVITGGQQTLLTSIDSFNTTPPFIVEQQVPLNSIVGSQTILARWNIGDTDNSFYSCVDLFIDSSADTTMEYVEDGSQLPLKHA